MYSTEMFLAVAATLLLTVNAIKVMDGEEYTNIERYGSPIGSLLVASDCTFTAFTGYNFNGDAIIDELGPLVMPLVVQPPGNNMTCSDKDGRLCLLSYQARCA